MNSVCRDLFQAIHEGKWLSIEYRNRSGAVTKYWIGIRMLDAKKRTLDVDALHLGNYQIKRLNLIYIDSILSSKIIDGSYFPVNEKLVEDISVNPVNYRPLFENMANLKILHYLEACNRMDATPYYTNFALIHQLDQDRFQENNDALIGGGIFGCGEYQYGFGPLMDVEDSGISLSERQFREIVEHFRREGNGRVSKSGRLPLSQTEDA